MYLSILVPHLCLISILILIRPTHADYCTDHNAIDVKTDSGIWACQGKSGDGHVTIFAAQDDSPTSTTSGSDDSSLSRRDIWDNSSWIPAGYSYQVSPYYKPASVLRACSGSVVTTYDTTDANLNGRGQTVVSQRNQLESSCANGTQKPITLYSGLGKSVKVIHEDIFFPGGVIHITDGLFTKPTLLSTTLSEVDTTVSSILSPGISAFDYIPSITVFIPSGSAILASLQNSKNITAGDARTLLNAQIVKGAVAYSPLLVDGAFFQAANGEEITITVANCTKYANGLKILQEDIIIENGVVHVVDGLFSTPSPSYCATTTTTITSSTVILTTSTITLTPRISTITSMITSTLVLPTTSTSTTTLMLTSTISPTPSISILTATPPISTVTFTPSTPKLTITPISPVPPIVPPSSVLSVVPTSPASPIVPTSQWSSTSWVTPATLPIPLPSIATIVSLPPPPIPTAKLPPTSMSSPASSTPTPPTSIPPTLPIHSSSTFCADDESSFSRSQYREIPTSIPVVSGWIPNSVHSSDAPFNGPGGYGATVSQWRA